MVEHDPLSTGRSDYRRIAAEYDALWTAPGSVESRRAQVAADYHARHVQATLTSWQQHLRKRSQEMLGNRLVVLGPGTNWLRREVGPLEPALADVEAIVGVDFSATVLRDFEDQFVHHASSHFHRVHTYQADLSDGRSVAFHDEFESDIDGMEGKDHLQQVELKLRELLTSLEQIETKIRGKEDALLSGEEVKQNVFFDIASQVGDTRLFISNLTMGGWFAVTENEMRQKVEALTRMNGATVSEDDKIEFYTLWHSVISRLNTYVSARMVAKMFSAQPEAQFMATTETDAQYKFGSFPRLDLSLLEALIKPYGVRARVQPSWKHDDGHERPPHTHSTLGIFFEPASLNGLPAGGSGGGMPASSGGGLPSQTVSRLFHHHGY